jgi:hypothetical protein
VRRGARTALIAATMLCGLVGSSAALVMDASTATARPPMKCKQTPDGNGCTQGSDGTGGGTPFSVADLYDFMGANSSFQDVFLKKDGGLASSQDAASLQVQGGYTKCSKSTVAVGELLCN